MDKACGISVDIVGKTLSLTGRDGSVTAVYPVIAGRNSHEGSKEKEGDQRTPRGTYYICTINEKSQFTLFFGISYPGPEDARKALNENRISEEQYGDIIAACSENRRPLWNTALGGQVGIHGGGIDRDGTRGCIGMKDDDVRELFPFVFMGMPVVIS